MKIIREPFYRHIPKTLANADPREVRRTFNNCTQLTVRGVNYDYYVALGRNEIFSVLDAVITASKLDAPSTALAKAAVTVLQNLIPNTL